MAGALNKNFRLILPFKQASNLHNMKRKPIIIFLSESKMTNNRHAHFSF